MIMWWITRCDEKNFRSTIAKRCILFDKQVLYVIYSFAFRSRIQFTQISFNASSESGVNDDLAIGIVNDRVYNGSLGWTWWAPIEAVQ